PSSCSRLGRRKPISPLRRSPWDVHPRASSPWRATPSRRGQWTRSSDGRSCTLRPGSGAWPTCCHHPRQASECVYPSQTPVVGWHHSVSRPTSTHCQFVQGIQGVQVLRSERRNTGLMHLFEPPGGLDPITSAFECSCLIVHAAERVGMVRAQVVRASRDRL